MPSAKFSARIRGFTLLEIGIVLFILMMLVGIAIPMISSLIAEERLREHARALLLYARTARRLAVSENRPYEILFSEHGFLLQPHLAAGTGNGDVVSSHDLGKEDTYSLERWGDEEFTKPVDQTWIFQPEGICEPIRVHFQDRKNWIEIGFNPLTARAQEETYSFQ